MSSGASTGRMYLIDAHSLIFQVFHAIPEMSSPSGLPTNALFGFTKDALTIRGQKPEYLVCAFDEPGPVFRSKIYAEYKAHRAPMPDDLQPQIPMIREMLSAMRIPVVGVPGYEADDVIATIAKAASQKGIDVFVCTSDKDCRQLIDDHVRLYNLRKNKIMDRAALLEDWCIAPEQVIDLQAMVGDSVDNIPGVPGIGLKTAAKLLKEFGTLDNILANVDRITGAKMQENLRSHGEKVLLSRRLVSLALDVPITWDWESWRLKDWDGPRLLELFQGWGLRGFAEQVRALDREKKVFQQGELFPGAYHDGADSNGKMKAGRAAQTQPLPKAESNWHATYHLVNTEAALSDFLKQLRQQQRIALDVESTSNGDLVGIAFCWKGGEAWYLPSCAPHGEACLDAKKTLAALKPLLEDANVAKVNQDIKRDLTLLRQHGIQLTGFVGDSMVADYLLHAGERSHSLADLANRYLDHRVTPVTELTGTGKKQVTLAEVPSELVAQHAGEGADIAWRACELLEPRLRQEGLFKLYEELEIPLMAVLAEMEFNGVRLDLELLKRLGKEMTQQLAGIEGDIYELAGHEFNIASPKQLRQVLFDEMKLPRQRKTGTTGEASTDQETLERLALLGHQLPTKIVEHRQIAKLKGTYVDALPALVNPRTGRLHATFNQTVAATGRLSSSDPNLQNIPVRTEQGRQIRQAFIPEAGWKLLTADYSQIELRLLAHFSDDAELRRAFVEDRDIHALVASQIYGVPEQDVNSDMRRAAKTINFGVIYGMSAHGLAQRLGITKEEAATFIDAYFARYPKVAAYQNDLLKKCHKNQYVSTILGRRRQITGIRLRSTYQQRNQPEREAINMEIQGSAADLIKSAMLNIYRRLGHEQRRSRLLLQIHDELVFEVPPEELNDVARLVNEEMTGALKLDVPLKVDVSAGANWLDVEEIA